MTTEDILQVFNTYISLLKKANQPTPELSSDIRDQIHQAIADYGLDDVILVLKYLKDANDNYASFMRGQAHNSTQAWLSLVIIFKESKWDEKLAKAKQWNSTKEIIHDLFIPFRIK